MIDAQLQVTRGYCPLCHLKRSHRFVLALRPGRRPILTESHADTALCRQCWADVGEVLKI
jgi:hypothetical protein